MRTPVLMVALAAGADLKKATLFKLIDITNIDIMLVQETHNCKNRTIKLNEEELLKGRPFYVTDPV